MLIPYSTDAPLYHYPVSTVSLIVINFLFFFAFCANPEVTSSDPETNRQLQRLKNGEMSNEEAARFLTMLDHDDLEAFWYERLSLQFGEGLLPWQWLTSMFMHMGYLHIIGNMFFLWAFGLILEGKLGWWRFAGLYLLIGMAQALIVQLLMFFSEGTALGASGAIFGLLALVVIFAPSNSFDTVLFVFLRPYTIEVSVLMFGFIYVAMNILGLSLQGGAMSSELLHMIGFAVGLPVGFLLLTRGFVDCEGYDIISYFQGQEGKKSTVGKKQRRERERKKAAKEDATNMVPLIDPIRKQELLVGQIDQAIADGQFDLAVALYQKIRANDETVRWKQSQLIAIIQHYVRSKEFRKAEPLILAHVESFDVHRYKLQLILLKWWLQEQRPRHALRYLQKMRSVKLEPTQLDELDTLANIAKTQIREGAIEVE